MESTKQNNAWLYWRNNIITTIFKAVFTGQKLFIWPRGPGSPANSNERGTVKVKNNDPFEHPIIDPNSLSHPQDLADMVKIRVHINKLLYMSHSYVSTSPLQYFRAPILHAKDWLRLLRVNLVKALKQTREIYSQNALKEYQGDEMEPGAEVQTDLQIETWLRNNLETCYHPVSTCKIGKDDLSPVDTEFKLKGIDNLRIADASGPFFNDVSMTHLWPCLC